MGSVTSRVILWTPSGPCAPWGASGPATTSPGPPSPSSSSSEILQNEEGTLKKARPRFYKERDSTKTEILQRTRFYKERDSPERGGHFEESPTEILHHRGPAPHGGHLGQQQQVQGLLHPHHQVQVQTPLLPSLQTKSTRSTGPGSCDSQDAQDAHQRPQRRGNKEVLELVLGSR